MRPSCPLHLSAMALPFPASLPYLEKSFMMSLFSRTNMKQRTKRQWWRAVHAVNMGVTISEGAGAGPESNSTRIKGGVLLYRNKSLEGSGEAGGERGMIFCEL